jgi:hypothetical protein
MNAGSNAASRGMAVLDRIRLTGPPATFLPDVISRAECERAVAIALRECYIRHPDL